MRILIAHCWLTGNLGELLMLQPLIRALRALRPDRLDLAGSPATPSPITNSVLESVDRLIPEDVRPPSNLLSRLRWLYGFDAKRRALFRGYDLIVSKPGPYLATYDSRSLLAMADLRLARRLHLPFVFSGHSIGPLPGAHLASLRRHAPLIVAREPETQDYLSTAGVPSVLAADYAFLHQPDTDGHDSRFRSEFGDDYRLVFVRFNNLAPEGYKVVGGTLRHGSHTIVPAGDGRMVLATSDAGKDERMLSEIGARLRLPVVLCRTLPELMGIIKGAGKVFSDRYHPAVCTALLERPLAILDNAEATKTNGLRRLLSTYPLPQLKVMAADGLKAVVARAELKAS